MVGAAYNNGMTKTRIIQRTCPSGEIKYVIQQKHFLFRWMWVDGWINSSCGANCTDSFGSLEEAQKNLWMFDGSKCTEKVCDIDAISEADEDEFENAYDPCENCPHTNNPVFGQCQTKCRHKILSFLATT